MDVLAVLPLIVLDLWIPGRLVMHEPAPCLG